MPHIASTLELPPPSARPRIQPALRLLLVEDDPADAEYLQAVIERGADIAPEIYHACNLAAAGELLAHEQFDAMLLDLQLPDGGGLATVDYVQQANDQIPIVVLTGNDDTALALQILQAGAQDYLIKWEADAPAMLRAVRFAIERKRCELELRLMVDVDCMTGLTSRQRFESYSLASCDRAIDCREQLALMMIDLDGFKAVNDTMGHDVGDQVLKIVGKRLAGCVRKGDTVARIGGDEFVVLLEGDCSQERIEQIARAIIERLCAPIQLAGRQSQIGVSVGISRFPQDATDSENLLKWADQAMYQAKQNGGKAYHFFSSKQAQNGPSSFGA